LPQPTLLPPLGSQPPHDLWSTPGFPFVGDFRQHTFNMELVDALVASRRCCPGWRSRSRVPVAVRTSWSSWPSRRATFARSTFSPAWSTLQDLGESSLAFQVMLRRAAGLLFVHAPEFDCLRWRARQLMNTGAPQRRVRRHGRPPRR